MSNVANTYAQYTTEEQDVGCPYEALWLDISNYHMLAGCIAWHYNKHFIVHS